MGLVSKQTWEFINNKFAKILAFYAIPKIHKSISVPPGRPIISGNQSILENGSKWINTFLRPFVTSLPFHVRYTLPSIDSRSLCPHWCHPCNHWCGGPVLFYPSQQGLTSGQDFFFNKICNTHRLFDFVLKLLAFILQHNTFVFNDSHFLQVQGVVIRTCYAPSFVNLYLRNWECFFAFWRVISIFLTCFDMA